MVARRKLGMKLEGLLLHYTAAIWCLSVFIGITSYTQFLRVVDPLIWFTAGGFFIAGIAFLAEGLITFPEKGKIHGIASAGLILVFGIINIGFGLATFFDWFNPYLSGTELVMFASIMIGISTAFLFITGTALAVLGKRVGKILAGKAQS